MFDCFARRLHRLGISGKGEGACGLAWCLRESAPVRRRAARRVDVAAGCGRRAVCRLRHAGGRMACGALSGRLRRGQTTRRGGSGRPRGAAAAHGGCLRRDVLGMKKSAICRGRRLEKLLAAQTGERALGLWRTAGRVSLPCGAQRPCRCLLHAERDAGWGDCDAASFDGFCRACGAFCVLRSSQRWNGWVRRAPDG